MDLLDAVKSGEIALVLGVIVVILAGAVAYLFKLVVDEMRNRRIRAEELTDRAMDLFDSLEESTKTAVAVARDNAEVAKASADLAQKSLDELRRR